MANSPQIDDFLQVLAACKELASQFPDIVFIGGIAVYLHTINDKQTADLAESTHYADFYISIADMSDLRDIEDVTPNRRLNKHQLIKRGIEFDIYTERHSNLILPYDQVSAFSEQYDSIQVAALEHLLILKLEAYQDRHASSKGQKDAKDLLRIGVIVAKQRRKFRSEIISGYIRDEHITLLERVLKGPEPLALARGNAKEAKSIRGYFSTLVEKVVNEYGAISNRR